MSFHPPSNGRRRSLASLFALPATALLLLELTPAAARAATPSADELRESRAWAEAHWEKSQLTAASTNAAAPPFSFRYRGRPCAENPSAWSVSHSRRQSDAHRTEHALRMTEQPAGLEVLCTAVVYDDFPAVEWTLTMVNRGSTPTGLIEDLQALDATLTPAQGECRLHHWTGDDCSPRSYTPASSALKAGANSRFAPSGGRPTTGAFPYFNLERPGGGVCVAVGWPGQWAAQFARAPDAGVRVRAGQERTRFRLEPGEQARSPLIALLFWQGDRTRAQNLWRRWMLAHNLPRDSQGRLPPPILSSCSGGFFPGLKCDEAGERQFIDAFAHHRIPLTHWWMDAGWYPCGDGWPAVGTWEPDPVRFPRGLRPVADHAHSKGLELILWFEPERVTPGSWLHREHPGWLLGVEGGTRLLNLGLPEARRWLTDHVDRFLSQHGIDLYRQDFNMDPLDFWRNHDTPERQGLTEIHHIEGYLAYWDELRRRHPDLIIDSCASGGRRNDLETLRRAVPLLRSDYQSFQGDPAFAAGNQAHTAGLASWIPYFGQGVYWNPTLYEYSARSHFGPGFGLACDVRQPGLDWDRVRAVATEWTRVAPLWLGDYYPLIPHSLDDARWIAWQFDRPDLNQGMLQVFRRGSSPFESVVLPLHALAANATYRLETTDTPPAAVEQSGLDLMARGLKIVLPDTPSAQTWLYQRVR